MIYLVEKEIKRYVGDNDDLIRKVVKKIDKKTYIDFSVPGLDKRSYIVKDNPPNLSSCIAFLAVRETDFKKEDVLLDPLCRGGKFLIEAAHFTNNIPPGKFIKRFAFMDFKIFENGNFEQVFKKWDKSKKRKLKIFGLDSYTGNIDNAKQNIKKANVKAKLSCRSIDWMDCLFRRNSVDKIVIMLPSGKHKSTEALYRELFYQSDYCLNKKGLMVVLSEQENLIKKYAEHMNLEIVKIIELNRIKLFKLKPLL